MPETRILPLCLLLLVILSGPGQADPRLVVSKVQLSGTAKRTVVTLEANQPVDVTVFPLSNPARIILDLPDVEFHLLPDDGKTGKGLVKAFRFGRFAPDKSRMVFDLESPALVGEVRSVSTVEGEPHRLTIELTRTSNDKFLEQVKKRNASGTINTPAEIVPQEPSIAGQQTLPLIVLDPGHGGIDGGANASGGFREKDFTLSFVRNLKEKLLATKLVRVMLTRDKDIFVPLRQRRQLAQENKAALFISIHADSFSRYKTSPRGATVYTLSEKASDQAAAAYAERENRADEIAGIENPPENNEVADILFDLMQRETKSFSMTFSHLLTSELRGKVALNSNPRRGAGFVVLKAPDVPAALLEMGYLSNDSDFKMMQSQDWQSQASGAIARAVLAFIERSQVTGGTGNATKVDGKSQAN